MRGRSRNTARSSRSPGQSQTDTTSLVSSIILLWCGTFVTHIITPAIFTIAAFSPAVWVGQVSNPLRRQPRPCIFTTCHVLWTLKNSYFALVADHGSTSQNGSEDTSNPIRERGDVVHGKLPECRHLRMRTQNAIEEFTHDDEERHEGRCHKRVRTRIVYFQLGSKQIFGAILPECGNPLSPGCSKEKEQEEH